MGDFAIRSVPSDHSRVERCCLLSLFFPQKIFRHNYNGRVLRFRVQSSLGCDGEKTGSLAPFSNDSQASLDPWSYSTLGLIPGDTFSKKDSGVVVMEGAYVAGPGL